MLNINGKEWNSLQPEDIQKLISEVDFNESFFFELKNDDVSPKKLAEEISAFANTFGGYIIIGVSDDKIIEGCSKWNEQRIHVTIHDSITPTPSFDVKKFTFDIGSIYVLKVDESAESPYMTSDGNIYERLSSGSFKIKDSAKLTNIYNKREQQLAKAQSKISIPEIITYIDNVYGYIDIGFDLTTSDAHYTKELINNADLKTIKKELAPSYSCLSYIGDSIQYLFGAISSTHGYLAAHANCFLEIMIDGSARMRIILQNNDATNLNVHMIYALSMLDQYKKVYSGILNELFPEKFIYARKYESLTVLKQFRPVLYLDSDIMSTRPDLKTQQELLLSKTQDYQKSMGINTVVTNNRIPKTGLTTIDKPYLEKKKKDFTANSIIDELFSSRFVSLGTYPSVIEE